MCQEVRRNLRGQAGGPGPHHLNLFASCPGRRMETGRRELCNRDWETRQGRPGTCVNGPGEAAKLALGPQPSQLGTGATNRGSRGLPQRQGPEESEAGLTRPYPALSCPGNQGLSSVKKTTGHPNHRTSGCRRNMAEVNLYVLAMGGIMPSPQRYAEALTPGPLRMWPHLGVGSWQVASLQLRRGRTGPLIQWDGVGILTPGGSCTCVHGESAM